MFLISSGRFKPDTESTETKCCNRLARSGGEIETLNPKRSILGISGLPEWSEKEVAVGKGDRLVLLTDGITETISPSGEFFGRNRIVNIIKDCGQKSVEDFSDTLIASLLKFRDSEKQLDDITMLSAEL